MISGRAAGNKDSELKSYPQIYPQRRHAGRLQAAVDNYRFESKPNAIGDFRYYCRAFSTRSVPPRDSLYERNLLIYVNLLNLVPRRGP